MAPTPRPTSTSNHAHNSFLITPNPQNNVQQLQQHPTFFPMPLRSHLALNTSVFRPATSGSELDLDEGHFRGLDVLDRQQEVPAPKDSAPNFALDLACAYGLSYVSSGPLGHSGVVSESTMTPTPPPMSSSLATPPVLERCQPIHIGSNKPISDPWASVPCETTRVQEDVLTMDQSFEEELTKPYGLSSSSQSTSYNPPIPQINDNSYVPLTPAPTPAPTPIQTEGPSLPMDQDDDYIATPPYASPYASPYATPPYIPYSPPSPPETRSSSRIMRELYDMEPNGNMIRRFLERDPSVHTDAQDTLTRCEDVCNTPSPEYYVPPPHGPPGDPYISAGHDMCLATTPTPGSNTPPPSYISSSFDIEDPSTTTLPSHDEYQMFEDYLATDLPTLSDTHTPTIEHCAEAYGQVFDLIWEVNFGGLHQSLTKNK
ncbi:hypothetical protein F4604DRAFT_1687187 [Suillus subluteus]|nr:hypothetical protein F4604DRAFT_1687187 [Suillus subluteus]